MVWKRLLLRSNNQVSSRNISYVQRARLLEKIKNDDEICRNSMQTGKFLLYSKGQPLLSRGSGPGDHVPKFVDYHDCVRVCPDVCTSSVVLSVMEDGTPTFASMISKETDPNEVEIRTGAMFTDLRVGLFLVNQVVAHQLSKGWSLLMWSKKNKFCPACGTPVIRALSGSGVSCPACSNVSYPSTSPVGIVSISDSTSDHLLLIRQPRYPLGMYSCVAGFVDSGETLEDCVKREVAEEVGLEIDTVQYDCSQHWPFPAGSLMIGCHATVKGGTPSPDPCLQELEDARWFDRSQIKEAVTRIDQNPRLRVGRNNNPEEIFIAPKGALAYSLITSWLSRK